jgi:uncharacterized protein (TIRG00374 family)
LIGVGGRALRRVLPWVRLAFGLALVYYVVTATGGWSGVRQFIDTSWLLLLVCSTPFVGAGIEALRLRVLFGTQGVALPVGQAYRLVSVGTLFNFAIPGGTGGDVMKLYYLVTDNRGKGVEVATVLLVDRLLALFSLLLVLLILALFNRAAVAEYDTIRWLVVGAGIVAMVLVCAAGVSWSDTLRRSRMYLYILEKAPFRVLLRRLSDSLYQFRHSLSAIAAAIGLSALGHVMLVGVFMAAGTVLVAAAAPATSALLSLLGLFANALPITPGGLGVGEAAFDRLFALLGYSGGALLVLSWRLGMVPLSLVGFGWYVIGVGGSTRLEHGEASQPT